MSEMLDSAQQTETSPSTTVNSFEARHNNIEGWVEWFADLITSATRLAAYTLAMAVWFVVGIVAWAAALVCAICILFLIMLFRLIAGLQIQDEANRFFAILRFWPDGFIALTRAFWTDHAKREAFGERSEPSYVFASLRVLYFIAVLFLIISVVLNKNALALLLTLPGNASFAILAIVTLTIGMTYFADKRKVAPPAATTTVPNSECPPNQGAPQGSSQGNKTLKPFIITFVIGAALVVFAFASGLVTIK